MYVVRIRIQYTYIIHAENIEYEIWIINGRNVSISFVIDVND